MITMGFDKKSKKLIEGMAKFESRWAEGLKKFTFAFVNAVKKEVESAGRALPDVDYSKLEVLWFGDELGFGIVLPESMKDLEPDELKSRAFVVQPKKDDPKLEILQRYSPWPASLLPFVPSEAEAILVARKVSDAELSARETELKSDSELQTDLSGVGLTLSQRNRSTLGVKVYEDVGWLVLRAEFGLSGMQQVKHWRPALSLRSDERFMKSIADGFFEHVLGTDPNKLKQAIERGGPESGLPVIFRFQKGLGF
jgi:hypothetical protein